MARNLLRALALGGAVLALGACGEEETGESFQLPPAGFVGDPARGQQLFEARCAECHGPGARGTTQGPPLVHRIYEPGHHADLAFYFAVRDGVAQHHWNFGNMPPVAGLSGEEVAHIVAYVRGLQRRAGIY